MKCVLRNHEIIGIPIPYEDSFICKECRDEKEEIRDHTMDYTNPKAETLKQRLNEKKKGRRFI